MTEVTHRLPKRRIAIDPITVVVKECILLSSSMRKNSKYAQSGVAAILSGGASELFEDHDLKQFSTGGNGIGSATSTNGISDPLLSGFFQLRLMLNNLSNLDDVDSLTLLQPFLLVIKSSSTTGAITSLALDSLAKFISYGIISPQSKNLNFTLTHIINSLTQCRFEASEQSSDDAVLLKVLKLLEVVIDSELGETLSDEVIHEVVQTSLSLACNKRRSEVLRRAAELSMYRITVKIFEKLDSIEPEEEHQHIVDDTHDYSRDELEAHALGTNEELESSEKKSLDVNNVARPFGLFAIKQFLGILIAMISPENQFKHTESTKVFSLSLITTAIELTADRFNSFPSLLTLVSDPVFKHTLQIIQSSNSLPVLQAALQLFTSLALTVGSRLQPQVELTLVTIFNTILPEPQSSKDKTKSKSGKTTPVDSNISKTQAAKELIIEELSILWTRSPDLFVNLFINYDCNFNRGDLAVKFIEFLAQLSLPESALFSSDSVPPICLEGLLSFVNDLSEQIKEISDFDNNDTHKLLQDKEKKREFINVTNIFNQKPKDGLQALAAKGFISEVNDEEVAKFFFKSSSRLNKKVLGEFIAKPVNETLLKKFLNLFDFKNLRVDEALRILLKTFRLPGESQQIERIVECFAAHYVASQDSAPEDTEATKSTEDEEELEPVRPDADAVFVLSYSIIMLNTDLHNPNIKAHMTIDDYKRNLRGVYGGKDFPAWYLEKIFQSIQDKEIVMPEEHHGSSQWFDDSWNNLISANVSIPIEEHNVSDFNKKEILQFKKYIFSNSFHFIADTVFKIFDIASDDQIITRMISTVDKLSQISSFFQLNNLSDDVVDRLCVNTRLTGEKAPLITANDSNTSYPMRFTKIKVEGGETINVTDVGIIFGKDFKAQLSTVVLFRIIQRNTKVLTKAWENIIKVLLSLIRYGLIEGDILKNFQEQAYLSELPSVKPEVVLSRSAATKGLFSTFASYLKGEDEPSDEDVEFILAALDCIKSANVVSLFDNVDQLNGVKNRSLIEAALSLTPTEKNDDNERYFEAQTFFILELIIDLIFTIDDTDEFIPAILGDVNDLLSKRESMKFNPDLILRLLTYRLILLATSSSIDDASALSVSTFDELSTYDRTVFETQSNQLIAPISDLLQSSPSVLIALLNHENFWKVLRTISSFSEYTNSVLRIIENLFKSDAVKPSPLSYLNQTNFMWLLGLLDEISAVGAVGGQWEQEYDSLVKSGHKAIKKENPYQDIVQVSLKSIKFTSSLLGVRKGVNKVTDDEIFALIQALAHQCLNPCFQIRSYALSVLETTIFEIDTSTLEVRDIFENGLFPLLKESTVERIVILKLISKIYLHYYEDGVNDEEILLNILDVFNQFLEEKDVEVTLQEFIQNKKALEKKLGNGVTEIEAAKDEAKTVEHISEPPKELIEESTCAELEQTTDSEPLKESEAEEMKDGKSTEEDLL